MQKKSRYPALNIRSKNELAKHISYSDFSKDQALTLINDVLINFKQYWKDSGRSEPEKDKYVRNARGTPLGILLKEINAHVLAPHDMMLPGFIFGGVKGKSHVTAAQHLIGKKSKRTLLKVDITRFFEQISYERVYHLFHKKMGCSARASKILAGVCCVPYGPKGSKSLFRTIGRGFATSSRLAIWCNLDIFIHLNYLVQKKLKGCDPRFAIYVDDIGITASRVSKETMDQLAIDVEELLLNYDPSQQLPLNKKKTEVKLYNEKKFNHLGLTLGRKSVSIGGKTRSKMDKLKNELKRDLSQKEKLHLRRVRKALASYKQYVENSKLA